jgi:hypothetical protein
LLPATGRRRSRRNGRSPPRSSCARRATRSGADGLAVRGKARAAAVRGGRRRRLLSSYGNELTAPIAGLLASRVAHGTLASEELAFAICKEQHEEAPRGIDSLLAPVKQTRRPQRSARPARTPRRALPCADHPGRDEQPDGQDQVQPVRPLISGGSRFEQPWYTPPQTSRRLSPGATGLRARRAAGRAVLSAFAPGTRPVPVWFQRTTGAGRSVSRQIGPLRHRGHTYGACGRMEPGDQEA